MNGHVRSNKGGLRAIVSPQGRRCCPFYYGVVTLVIGGVLRSDCRGRAASLIDSATSFLASLVRGGDLFDRHVHLHRLRAFMTITRRKALKHTTRALGLDRPTLSGALGRLRRLANTHLFRHNHRKTRLALPNRRFLARTIEILSTVGATKRSLRHGRNLGGSIIEINTLPATTLKVLPSIVNRFRRRRGRAALRITAVDGPVVLTNLGAKRVSVNVNQVSSPRLVAKLGCRLLFLRSLGLIIHPGRPLLRRGMALDQILR